METAPLSVLRLTPLPRSVPGSPTPSPTTWGRRWGRSLAAACLWATVAAGAATAQVVSHSFEDGSLQGWYPRGSMQLTNTTEAARTGDHSLKVTGRTQSWQGPGLDLRTVLQPSTEYQISGWVRLVDGQPSSPVNFTLENVPNSGNQYPWVGNATVTSTAWSQLQGTFTTGAVPYTTLQLYVESSNATLEFYLDDVTITGPAGPPPPPPSRCPEPLDQSGFDTGFETGLEGWGPRGSVTLTRSTAQKASGDYSLLVTGRTASWNGATTNVQCKLHLGSKYFFGVKVRLAEGETPVAMRVSLQRTLNGVTTFPTLVGNQMVTPDAWVDLSREFTWDQDSEQLQLYVETASGTASFYMDDALLVHLPVLPIQEDIPSVHEVLAPYFPVGAAVTPSQTAGRYGQLLDKHFNLVVAENAQKWDAIQPTEGSFNWAPADVIANYARDRGIKMRYHTLLWHTQVPAWVFRDANGNEMVAGNAEHRELLLQRLRTHIHAIVNRYDDVVESWDVVNEVIADGGGLRNSRWLQIIGPEYLDHAFRYAAEVATGALFINDYNTNAEPKRTTLRNVVQGLLDRGVPIHGVGHQMHVNIDWPSVADIRQTLDMFSALGLMNEITEMDMSVYTNSTDTSPVTEDQLVRQGYRYRDIFNLYRELSPYLSSVTLWGLSDDVSWLKNFPISRDDKPLLFDEDQQAKHAYWGVVDPTMLPIIPKELRVTAGSTSLTGAPDRVIDAIAPTALETVTESGSWASFKTVWSPNTLYVVVDVLDPTADAGDRVDLFLDEGNEKAGAYDDNDYSYSSTGFGRRGNAFKTEIAGGYRLKVAVPVNRTLVAGDEIGFDVRVTDASTGRQLSWSDTTHSQDVDTSGFGTLHLSASKQVTDVRYGSPVVDAMEDKVWKQAKEIVTERFVLGTDGATARVKLLWDATHLYVYATVTDPVLRKESPNVWEQDSVEIFLDQNNAQTPTYQSDDGQYRVNYDNEQSFGGGASAAKLVSATRVTANGYVVEAAIALDAVTAAPGVYLGFDVQVNDAGSAAPWTRHSVATWNDSTGNAFQDTSVFGALRLLSAGM